MIARIYQPPSDVKIKALYISFEFGLQVQGLARGDARIARVTCILGLVCKGCLGMPVKTRVLYLYNCQVNSKLCTKNSNTAYIDMCITNILTI